MKNTGYVYTFPTSHETKKLAGRTIFVTGASRGIGKAIALKAAKDGANVVIAAKTAEPHPKLPGTIYTAAEEIEKAGGKALPCIVDVRNEQQVRDAVRKAAETFGGIDILVNNASAISITPTCETDMKKYDLMHNINTRGTFMVSKECIPYLKKSNNAHILNISPPLSMDPRWFEKHTAYTMAKYGMSMCVLGMAQEFKNDHIAVNALWPLTTIDTAAITVRYGSEGTRYSRTPEIMADAAYEIFCRDPKSFTGNFLIDEFVLREAGVSDFKQYACDPNDENLVLGFFLDESICETRQNLYSDRSLLSGSKIGKLFSRIQGRFNKELVKKLQIVIVFNITGEESGTWYLDLKNGSGKYGQGQPPTPADAGIVIDFKVFEEIFTGKRKAMNAYMSKKMQITGNIKLGLKIDSVIALPSKL